MDFTYITSVNVLVMLQVRVNRLVKIFFPVFGISQDSSGTLRKVKILSRLLLATSIKLLAGNAYKSVVVSDVLGAMVANGILKNLAILF